MIGTMAELSNRVSVVIPLYNHERYIETAISSVLAQGEVVREILVIDDGSTDDSFEVAKALTCSCSKLRVFGHSNRGAHATINRGIVESSSELVAILNSDDFFLENRLNKLVSLIDENPHVSLVGSGVRFVNDRNEEETNDWYLHGCEWYRSSSSDAAALINANIFVTTSNFLIKRELFESIGLFAPLRYAHDLDFLMRMLANGKHFLLHKEPLIAYRFHATNTIKENHSLVRAELALIAAQFLYLSSKKLSTLSWADQSLVSRVLREHSLTPAALLCLTEFIRHSSSSLEINPFDSDPFLKEAVLGVV